MSVLINAVNYNPNKPAIMEIQNYFSADTASGYIVTQILTWSFIIWLIALALYTIYLAGAWRKLSKSVDVSILEEFLKNQVPVRKKNFGPDEQKELQERAEAVFNNFSGSVSLKQTSPISRHIKAIFDAGWKETRLDISELIKHTTEKLFGPGKFLKSLLTLFLIVGLFGTLIGLAESFSNLSQFTSRDQYNSQTQLEFTDAVKNLLVSLKGAFAPSLLGILYTVIGVFIFSIIVTVFSGLKSNLERITLTKWVPELFATTTLRRRFEAAEKVADFADDVQKVTEEFKVRLERTNGTLEKLTLVSENLIRHSDLFVQGVKQIQNFEEKLHDLYQQMVRQSETFHNNVKSTLQNIKESQEKASQNLENQGKQIEKVITGLKSYEDAYIRGREEMDRNIKEVLVAARNSYSGIVERNSELITKIGDPLRNELVTKIGELSETMNSHLSSINKRFAGFDAPITEAAQKIGKTLDVVLERTDKVNQQFHNEFIEQTRNNTEQLKELKTVSGQVGNIFGDLLEQNAKQTAQFDQINGSLKSLSGSITSLSRTVTVNGSNRNDGNTPQHTALSLFQLAEMLLKIIENGEVQKERFNQLEKSIESLKKSETEAPSQESGGWGTFSKQ